MEKKILCYGGMRAVILPERGANCVSLRCETRGLHILREYDPAWGEPDNPYLYGMPVLFPVNRISGGRFEFEGREYVFPINEPNTGCTLHGELHRLPFEVEKEEPNRLVCSYSAEPYAYLGFPHGFTLRIEYTLVPDGMVHRVTVTNRSKTNMPLMLGFHTTFLSRLGQEEKTVAGVEIAEEYERNMSNYLPTGHKPSPDEVTEALVAGIFDPLSQPISRHYRAGGERMSICCPSRGLELVYENDPQYGFRLIYGGGEQGFICLEPQTCLADCANSSLGRKEGGFRFLTPGATAEFVSKITIKEMEKK